jgi:hypothetical protein
MNIRVMQFHGFTLLVLSAFVACSQPSPMPAEHSYSHDVQLVHFRWDQTEERGPVDADAAVAAFRSFPFGEQQEQAQSLPEPTFPTVTFRSHSDGAILSIWSLEPGEYEVYMEHAGQKVTIEESSEGRVEQIILDFFAGLRADLHAQLSTSRGAVVKSGGFFSKVKALLGIN